MSGAYCYSRNLYRDPSNSDPEPVALVTPEEGHWRSGGRSTLGWGSQAAQEHLEGCIMLSANPLLLALRLGVTRSGQSDLPICQWVGPHPS